MNSKHLNYGYVWAAKIKLNQFYDKGHVLLNHDYQKKEKQAICRRSVIRNKNRKLGHTFGCMCRIDFYLNKGWLLHSSPSENNI